jgi:hypothetical protein
VATGDPLVEEVGHLHVDAFMGPSGVVALQHLRLDELAEQEVGRFDGLLMVAFEPASDESVGVVAGFVSHHRFGKVKICLQYLEHLETDHLVVGDRFDHNDLLEPDEPHVDDIDHRGNP